MSRSRFAHRAAPRDLVFCMVAVLNALPLAASVVRSGLDHYVPASDWALTEMSVRAVGTRATPLVGAWSRFGWRHPGPLPFYLLAIPYRLAGSAPFGIQLGAILINGAAIIATLLILQARGRLALVAGGLGLMLLQFGLWPNLLRNEWNVALGTIPFALVLVAGWSANTGSRLSILLLPIVATFVMQTHIAYVALALPALLAWIYAVRRQRDNQDLVRAARIGIAVSAVLWLPVALDAVLHRGGNLRHIAGWATGRHPHSAGLSTALHLVGDATSLRFPFVRGLHLTIFGELDRTYMGPVPGALIVIMVGLLVLAWRRCGLDRGGFLLLLLATWIVGIVATSRIGGPLYQHLFWWSFPLTMISWLAAVLMLATMSRREHRASLRKPASVIALLLMTFVSASLTVRVARSRPTYSALHDTIVSFSRATQRQVNGRSVVVIDRTGDYDDRGSIQAGMMAHLDHSGVTGKVTANAGKNIFTADRIERDASRDMTVLVAGRETLLAPPGRLLAQSDPLTPTERDTWTRDYSQLRRALIAAHHRELVALLPTTFEWSVGQHLGAELAAQVQELQQLNLRGEPQLLWLVQR